MAQTKFKIEVNGHELTATLEDNSSAKDLVELLEKGPLSVEADAYGGFEMVGSLPVSLSRNDRQVTTKPGDIILYLGSNICFYYGVNSWNFTRLGSVDNAGSYDLKSIYGVKNGSAVFVLSLAGNSAVGEIESQGSSEVVAIHRLDGGKIPHNSIESLENGVYVVTERFPGGKSVSRKVRIDR